MENSLSLCLFGAGASLFGSLLGNLLDEKKKTKCQFNKQTLLILQHIRGRLYASRTFFLEIDEHRNSHSHTTGTIFKTNLSLTLLKINTETKFTYKTGAFSLKTEGTLHQQPNVDGERDRDRNSDGCATAKAF